MHYRRVYIEGGCYFFTLALADRKSDLLVREIDRLRAAFKAVRKNHPFERTIAKTEPIKPTRLKKRCAAHQNNSDVEF